MKVPRKLIKNTAKIVAIIVLIPIILLLVFAIVRVNGKRKLYDEVVSSAPAPIIAENISTTVDVEIVEKDDSYDWKEGDIRHNGNIYRYNDQILTFLVMGIDKKGKVSTGEVKDYMDGGQADALFLAVVNPKSEIINIVAVNRNTLVDIDMYDHDGSFVAKKPLQINLQHGYGDGRELSCERQVEVVSKLFMNIPIHGYVSINMGAVPEINDAVDGVPVKVMENTAWQSKNLRKNVGNEIVLKGQDAYEYIHHRDVNVFDSAGDRLIRQKQYLTSFINSAKRKTKEDITFPVTLYKTVSDYVVTDVTVSEMSYLASELIKYQFDSDNIYSMTGTTETVEGYEEFYPDEQQLYEMIIELFYERVLDKGGISQ